MGASGVGMVRASSHEGRSGAKSWSIAIVAIIAVAAVVLLTMGRSAICPCGTIRLWHGIVASPENSQQLSDWYSLSHVVHGLIFYGLARVLLPRQPIGLRLTLAVLIEAAWEIAENSPMIIDRYRAATIAVGYTGDSVLNSVSDIAMMMVGFAIARRFPWWGTVMLAIMLELIALWAINDNLTLNVWMLIAPNDAIRTWQSGA